MSFPLLLLHSAAFHKGSTRGFLSIEALPVFLPLSNYLAFGRVPVVLSWSGKSLGKDDESASKTFWE